jgi:hypothetical protein
MFRSDYLWVIVFSSFAIFLFSSAELWRVEASIEHTVASLVIPKSIGSQVTSN